jgi:hypothetical protein
MSAPAAEGASPPEVDDHPFRPRVRGVTVVPAGRWDRTPGQIKRDSVWLPPCPYLCEVCRLAEAAHAR